MKNIVNIINFVRGIEPREGRNFDLVEPVREQIALLRKYNLKGTFLLQYDALIDSAFTELLLDASDVAEVGVWFETVKDQVEAAGEKWNGRYPWDWYNDVGFLIGYEPQKRHKIIDVCMDKFKEIFGKYPECAGSWHIDAVSMKYLSEKYNISALCICRDQVGTDGYTMQGGFFNQAYYPSVNNMFCPANSKETQIDVPVFRMLGSDAIYAYDYRAYPEIRKYGVPTLEPASEFYGGDEEWCKWFFGETFCGNGLSFQYTQVGQENSFGWPRMAKGLNIQHELIKRMSDNGEIDVMTLSESGKWFKENFDVTPAATITALSDMRGLNKKSVWYNSRFYRVNLLFEDGSLRVRDMYVFNDKYKELYLEKRCETHACQYRNLPVMDSVLYAELKDGAVSAGVYFTENGENIRFDTMEYSEKDNISVVTLTAGDKKLNIVLSEKAIELCTDIQGLELTPVCDKDYVYGTINGRDSDFGNHNNGKVCLSYISSAKVSENGLYFEFDGMKYGLSARKGAFSDDFSLRSDDGSIVLDILNEI